MSREKTVLKIMKNGMKTALMFLFVFSTLIPIFAQDVVFQKQFLENNSQKYILDNGMTVILKDTPSSPLVSLVAIVKTGSATEGEFLGSGISHFVEHLFFKGTKKREVGQIAREIESLGGEINGFTTYDYTGYTITLPKEGFDKGLEILADALMNPQFDLGELEKERGVILGEVRLYQDDPGRRLSKLFFASAYTRHPYQHPIIGYEPLLKNLKRDDLLRYYKKMYVPNNIVLAVAGDIDRETLSRIEDEFKEFKMEPYVLRNIPTEPEQLALRRVENEYPTKLTRMFLGFKGVSMADKDLFALDVLALILGQGESSRLYREIYKKKELVYSIEASNLTLMGGGIFAVNCALEKEKTDEAIEAVYLEIEKVKKGEIGIQELKKAKKQVISSYIFSRQTNNAIASDFAISEVVTGDFDFSTKYVQAVESLTPEDIQKVAKKYLNKETLTIAILNPIGPKEEVKKEAEKKIPEIEKTVLDNGLTVLLREEKSLPIVSMKIIFAGGVRRETEAQNGISNLISRMLLRGTEKRPSETIAETIESLGGEIDAFSGDNSFGLSLNILSQDIETGIELLADVITNSVFPQKELEKEKKLALAQIKAQDDSIFKLASKSLKKTLFKTHPYRFDPLGEEESVKRISRQDVVEFYNNSLAPKQMVLAVFGDIKSQDVLELIKDKFAKLTPKEIAPILLQESFPQKLKEAAIPDSKEQTVMMFGFPGVKFTSPERYSLEVLDSLLTSMSGRLYQKIREELGEAYTLGGGSIPGIERGFYYLYVSTTWENLEKTKEIVLREIKDLQTNYVNDKELSSAKAYLCGVQKANLETNSALALKSGLDELYGLGFDHYKLYQKKINSITREDIKQTAKAYLNTDTMAVVTVKPKTGYTKMNQ